MATFRCKATGNTVTFTLQHDIDAMIGHDAYEEVTEDGEVVEHEEVVDTSIPFTAPVGAPKTRGRPPKKAK
jgi:hypothetical protein